MIWLAWINGAVYHDLHGRADGRTCSYLFLQMCVLALLAVFTGKATADNGPAFAVVCSAYLVLRLALVHGAPPGRPGDAGGWRCGGYSLGVLLHDLHGGR